MASRSCTGMVPSARSRQLTLGLWRPRSSAVTWSLPSRSAGRTSCSALTIQIGTAAVVHLAVLMEGHRRHGGTSTKRDALHPTAVKPVPRPGTEDRRERLRLPRPSHLRHLRRTSRTEAMLQQQNLPCLHRQMCRTEARLRQPSCHHLHHQTRQTEVGRTRRRRPLLRRQLRPQSLRRPPPRRRPRRHRQESTSRPTTRAPSSARSRRTASATFPP
mmetsp:Transcript_4991/g.16149  ORF Transcript_4991/g.16149 Transcript_4991/m.16149 type:complete len:216 (-) Transcript_4991:1224-1871(-)